jgi:geranylgeranyl reductase family protein
VRVAIIGAGVAGSFLAWLLSRKGVDCVIYDGAGVREKPCGGGCTSRVTRRYPFLTAASIRKNLVRHLSYHSNRYREINLELEDPIWIYSRRELDGFLLEQALKSGARLRSVRVVSLEQESGQWRVRDTEGESTCCDFLVGADGALSLARKRLSQPLAPEDLSVTIGYYIPGALHPDRLHVRFADPGWDGYLWALPRIDHVSLGVGNRYRWSTASQLRAQLDRFARDLYGAGPGDDWHSYAAPVPTLRARTLKTQKIGGDSWALIGDAAGLVDPITAEGIPYAMRSAELLAEALAAGQPAIYEDGWRADFGRDLIQAARLKNLFFHRRVLGDTFINRMLGVTRRSPLVRKAQNDLIAGRISYYGLFGRLALHLPRIAADISRWRGEAPPR